MAYCKLDRGYPKSTDMIDTPHQRRLEILARDRSELPASITAFQAEQSGFDISAGVDRLDSAFDPNIHPETAMRLIGEVGLQEVVRTWLIYAGARPCTDNDKALFHAKPETVAQEGLFHAAVRIGDRRTSVRFSPPEWGGFASPFTLKGHDGVVDLSNDSIGIRFQGEALEPESACLKNIAYKSDGRDRLEDQSITVNPIQSCPMRCKFCRRQYDQYDLFQDSQAGLAPSARDRLVNLKPEELAVHLLVKYPELNWSSNMQIAIVTGTFANFKHMFTYIEQFVDTMSRTTQGKFDPRVKQLQNIHVLSHLARTRDEMDALRSIGVKTYQDTAEIVNDDRRAALMPKANPKNRVLLGKGELKFEDILQSVADGVEVFGRNNYFVTLILGLDTYDDTMRGLQGLAEAGLTYLDRPAYQPFELGGISLYAMGVTDLIRASFEAGRRFRTVSTTWRPESIVRER